jgi:hypothetical protein
MGTKTEPIKVRKFSYSAMLSHRAPAVVSAAITPARIRRSQSGRKFCVDTAVE